MTDMLFVLPVSGGSGGAHSVMQEADAMRRLGVDAIIAVNADNASRVRRAYADLPSISKHVVGYAGAEGLGALIAQKAPGVAIATTNQSVHVLAKALRSDKVSNQRTAYYIQDYEPLFYAADSDDWLTARSSYGLIRDMVHFAKTGWLQETVRNNHGIEVYKVEPSIDHAIYYPRICPPRATGERLAAVAMLRPATARRAPRRTVRLMNRLVHEFSDQLSCSVFGCSDDELTGHSLELKGIENHGVLPREQVGALFRGTDLFLDLSDYQAFGRTAIEAMSCGAIPIVPVHGGTSEFACDGINAFVVDTRDDDAVLAAVAGFLGLTGGERSDMRLAGITAGFRHSPEIAALSEIKLLASQLLQR